MTNRNRIAGTAGIVAATLAAYAPVWRAGFVWNDPDYVTRPALRSLAGLGHIWTRLGATEQYYPLLHSFFWLQHRLWGNAAQGYHVLNVLLHAANACLVWVLLERIFLLPARKPHPCATAWFAAAIFAVHPVMAESVAWISEEKNTLSLLFALFAALAYLRFSSGGKKSAYWLGLAWFVCALLCKTVTATLPAALLVIVWWKRLPTLRRHALLLAPWLALGAGSGLFSAWVERTYVHATGSAFALTFLQRLLLAARIPWFYLKKLLYPARLVFIYPHWTISASSPAAWLYLAFTVAVLTACTYLAIQPRQAAPDERNKSQLIHRDDGAPGRDLTGRAPLALVLLYLGTLFPTIGFLNVYAFIYSYVADHWVYVPAISIFAAAAYLLTTISSGWPAATRAAGAGMLLLLLGALTFRECLPYRNAGTFYSTIALRNPAAWMAEDNLGDLLVAAHRPAEALPYYEKALQAREDLPINHYNYGIALSHLTRYPEAIGQFQAALADEPRFALAKEALAEADNALGVEKLSSADYPAAARLFQAAIHLRPAFAIAWANLGRVLVGAGRTAAAITPLEEALRLDPTSAETENDLGAVFARLGRPADAIPHYENALRLRPDFPAARQNLQLARHAAP